MAKTQSVSASLLCGSLLTAVACGGGASFTRGPMPRGGSFGGVWNSPQYGRMELVQTGREVVGEYVKNERRGRVEGRVRGNVLEFEWVEQRELVAGRPVTTRGRGYFAYAVGDDGDHYLQGEWGRDDQMTGGGPWNAVKDRRRRPATGSEPASERSSRRIEAFDRPQ